MHDRHYVIHGMARIVAIFSKKADMIRYLEREGYFRRLRPTWFVERHPDGGNGVVHGYTMEELGGYLAKEAA